MSSDVITAIRCIVKLQNSQCCATRENNGAFIHPFLNPNITYSIGSLRAGVMPRGICSEKLCSGGCNQSTSKAVVDISVPRSCCVKTAQKLDTPQS